jgi:hypothetical protein
VRFFRAPSLMINGLVWLPKEEREEYALTKIISKDFFE